MLLKCLAISVLLCLPLRAFGYYHGKKHTDHEVYDKEKKDLEEVDYYQRHLPFKDTNMKDYNSEKKHNSNRKHHNDHVRKVPLIKKRRSVNEESTLDQQFRVDGGEYAITTDYPSFRRFNRDVFDEARRLRIEHESRMRKIEKIRADLMRRFGSYLWRHSFKPEIWDNLYKEVENSMDRMRQFHEEQREKFFQPFPENSYGKNGGQKVTVDDKDYDKEKSKKINEEEYFATITDHHFFGTTSRPFFGPGGVVLGPQTFPPFPDDETESKGHDLHSEKFLNKSENVHEYSNKRKGHKNYHHHRAETKTTFINHNFDSNDKHKNHNHNSQCRHHPSLGHYGNNQSPSSGIHVNPWSHHVVKVTLSTTSKCRNTHPKVTSKPNTHGKETTTNHSDINEHLKNFTESNSNKELFVPLQPDLSVTTDFPHDNSSTSYSVYEKPEEEVREFRKPISDVNITTLNKPLTNMSATQHPVHINYDFKKEGKIINSSDSQIHFPVDDANSETKQVSTDPCKNGGSINIPLLNVDLPCGDVGFNGGQPDDYYKREFATSMTDVFRDYIEKEKEQKETDEALDIDIRIGRKRRAAKYLADKANKSVDNLKDSGKGNASIFGEIMDVPKNLSKNDSNEYFDLTMLSDYFLEAVESLDEASLVDVLVALKEDYLSKSPRDQAVVDEVYDKLVSSLLEYKRSNGDWNERRRRESPPKTRPEAAAALELLAETDQHYESEQQDDPSVNEDYGEYNDRGQALDSNEDPSFLELVSLADKHKLKSR